MADVDALTRKLRKWWVVVAGSIGLTIVVLGIIILVMFPSTAILEADSLVGPSDHEVTIDGEYVVLDFGRDREANIGTMVYRLYEQESNRTVFQGRTQVYSGDAEVGPWSRISHEMDEKGEYNLSLVPEPDEHLGTYSVAMNETGISQWTRVRLQFTSAGVSCTVLVLGYLNYRLRRNKGASLDRTSWIEMALVSVIIGLAMLTFAVA